MRHAIETALRDGTIVNLEDDESDHGDYRYFLQEDERQPRRRQQRRFAAFPIVAVAFLSMGLMVLYFADFFYFEVLHSETSLPVEKSTKTGFILPQSEADQASVEAKVKQAVKAPPREGRASVMTGEFAEKRPAINGLDRQLPAEVANFGQSIGADQQKIIVLAREATAARQELIASREQHRRALEEERARSAALASDLATAQRGAESQAAQSQKVVEGAAQQKQAAESTIAELRQSLQQEQKKTAALMQEAKAAQATTTGTEQQRRALDEAQTRAAALLSELAGTRREIETQAAQSQKVVEEAAQQKQAAESTAAELRQSLQQEQKKTAALMQEAKAAQATTTGAEPQRRAFEAAEARAAALTRELAGARRELETQAAQSQKVVEEAAQQKQAAESTIAELRQSPQQEHQRAETLSSEVRQKLKALATLSRQKHDEDAQLKPVSTEAKGSGVAALLARAKVLVGQGNIRAARDVLERAAETGSAQATFALAETYDPNVLATWRKRGTQGDPTKARDLYARAYDAGIEAAKDRSRALVVAGGERKPTGWFGREETEH